MKYQNKILSVLKEAIDTSNAVKNITNAIDKAKGEFEAKGFNEPQSKRLAIDAVTKSVMGGDDTITEVGDEKVHTAKFDRCVNDVKKKGDVNNPYAICQASIGADAIEPSHQDKPENEYVRTQHEQKEVKTREYGEAGSEDYEDFQDAINQSMDEHPPAGIVGKIKKGELERVMESLKPKKKIIKVKELKSKK